MYITRIAPSPTGHLHIGNVRTAYFNWLAAKAFDEITPHEPRPKGKFILRIDDTDPVRSEQKYVDSIIETLKWLGLDYDDLQFQSKRYDRYLERANFFLESGWAVKSEGAIKLKLPDVLDADAWNMDWQSKSVGADGGHYWVDEITGPKKITNDDYQKADGSVLIRSDNSPTYNWASVIDDMDFGVNLIIRGTDHITNTSKQVMLWHLLGAKRPKFAHVGLIGENGKPMSKRDGVGNILYYRDNGYEPEAVLNFLARLGWGPKVDDKTTALLPRERMLSLFWTGGKMKANIANFDIAKLDSFNRKYKGRNNVSTN